MRAVAGWRSRGDGGYAMVALLVAMSVMAVMMTVALPVWTTAARREKEAELVFRGEQYARAIALFQRRNGNAIPPNIDVLIDQKFLRKKYKDPITGDDFQLLAPGTPIPGQDTPPTTGRGGGAGSTEAERRRQAEGAQRALDQARRAADDARRRAAGGTFGGAQAGGSIIGVVSKSTERSLRLYNGRDRYNEWVFLGTQQSTQAGRGARGGAVPGGRGGLPPGVSPGRRGGRGGRLTLPPPGARGGSPFAPMPETQAPPRSGTQPRR